MSHNAETSQIEVSHNMGEKLWKIVWVPVEPEEEPRYKAGPGIPDYLVGKTLSEAAELTQLLYRQLMRDDPT